MFGTRCKGDRSSNGNYSSPWWLRSPGRYQNNPAAVGSNGSLEFNAVNYPAITIRPAIWVNLDSPFYQQ